MDKREKAPNKAQTRVYKTRRTLLVGTQTLLMSEFNLSIFCCRVVVSMVDVSWLEGDILYIMQLNMLFLHDVSK